MKTLIILKTQMFVPGMQAVLTASYSVFLRESILQ